MAQTVKRLWATWETRVQFLGRKIPRRRKWQSTPALSPGKSHGRRSLVGCSPWGHQESDKTERLHFHFSFLKAQLFSCHKRSEPRPTDPIAISQEEKVLNNFTLGLQILVYRPRIKVTILTYPLSEFLQTHQLLLLLLNRFSHVRLCVTPETAAHQASPSLGFSRQEHWSGLPFPSPMHESEK